MPIEISYKRCVVGHSMGRPPICHNCREKMEDGQDYLLMRFYRTQRVCVCDKCVLDVLQTIMIKFVENDKSKKLANHDHAR